MKEFSSLQEPLELWVYEDLLLPNIRPNPLLMNITPFDTDPELEFWNRLREVLSRHVIVHRFKELSQAGRIVITPHGLGDYFLAGKLKEVYEFNSKVLASKRKLITFTGPPSIEYKPRKGEIVFATSVYQDPADRSIPIPIWIYDLGNKVSPISKPVIPTVGFVGDTKYPGKISNLIGLVYLPNLLIRWLACNLSINRSLPLSIRRVFGRLVRKKTLDSVRQASNLSVSLIERSGNFFTASLEEQDKNRKEYIQNIQDNAYILCMRGDENSSYRLYEVMSSGRIPVIINTNMKLPQLDRFSWEKISILISYKDLPKIGEVIQSFHDKLTSDQFEEVCLGSREAFEHLAPHNFIMKILHEVNLNVIGLVD